MTEVIKNNLLFTFIMLSWLAAGMISSFLALLIIPLFLLLFRMNSRYQELFIGFLFILILSDSLEMKMAFAKTFKSLNIVLLALFLISDQKNFMPLNRMFYLFIPFMIMAFICLIYAEKNLLPGAQKTISYFLLFIIVPNFVLKNYRDYGPAFFKNLLYFMLAIIVAGVVLIYVNREVAISHGERLRGVFGNPNGLGIFLILTFILFHIVNNCFPELFSRLEMIIFYLVIFYVTYKTGSRTALLAIVLFLVFTQAYRISPTLGLITFIASLLGAEFFMQNYETIIRAAGMEKYFRVDNLQQGSGRTVAWEFAWENIQKSMFVGKGFGYDEVLMRTNFDYLSRLGHEGGVHNTYLILWLNTGLIGLLLFLRGFFLVFIKAAKRSPFAIPVMFAVMFSINFEPWLAASLNPFTIVFLTIATLLTDEEFVWNTENDLDNKEMINQDETEKMAALD